MGEGDDRQWVRRTIDESFSQVHALKLVDIDGDGEMELLAEKALIAATTAMTRALTTRWCSTTTKSTARPASSPATHISVNGTAGGSGTQFVAEDLDGDGDIDIVTAGKTGVHFIENLNVDRVPKAQREKEILLEKNWPFPGEGPVVQQDEPPK